MKQIQRPTIRQYVERAQGTIQRRRRKELKSQRGWRTVEQGPLNLLAKWKWTHRLKQKTQGLHGSAPDLLNMYYSFKLSLIIGLLSVRMSGSLMCMLILRTLFLLLSHLVKLQYDDFCFILLYFIFFMLGYYLLEDCPFLMRDRE